MDKQLKFRYILGPEQGRRKTWLPTPGEEPYRVMRKQWYHTASSMYKFTDQMPVGVDIRGTGKLAFAMEDVDSETSSSSSHSVSVVYSPGTPGWTYLKDDEVGPSTRTDKLGRDACAPYLVQFPSGETILSYSRETEPGHIATRWAMPMPAISEVRRLP